MISFRGCIFEWAAKGPYFHPNSMHHHFRGPLLATLSALAVLTGCQGNSTSTNGTATADQTVPADTAIAPSPADGITAAGIG